MAQPRRRRPAGTCRHDRRTISASTSRHAVASGGQKARLALAAVLLAQPDILLLDEPTNDLDADGLARLEAHVHRSRAGIALVSHDRAFLAATVDEILELDEFTRRGTIYGGGYDAYVAERDAARQRAIDAYSTYEDARSRLVESARTQREWAREGVAVAKNPRRQSGRRQAHQGRTHRGRAGHGRQGLQGRPGDRALWITKPQMSYANHGACSSRSPKRAAPPPRHSRCGMPSSSAASSGSARSTSTSSGATGSGSPGRTASARRR